MENKELDETSAIMLALMAVVAKKGAECNFEEGPQEIIRKMANAEYDDIPPMPEVLSKTIIKILDAEDQEFSDYSSEDTSDNEIDGENAPADINEMFAQIFGIKQSGINTMHSQTFDNNHGDLAAEPEGFMEDGSMVIDVTDSGMAMNLLPENVFNQIPDKALRALDEDGMAMKVVIFNPDKIRKDIEGMGDRLADVEKSLNALKPEMETLERERSHLNAELKDMNAELDAAVAAKKYLMVKQGVTKHNHENDDAMSEEETRLRINFHHEKMRDAKDKMKIHAKEAQRLRASLA